MRLIISRILHRFDFEPTCDQGNWHDKQRIFGLWKKSPFYIRLQQRKEASAAA